MSNQLHGQLFLGEQRLNGVTSLLGKNPADGRLYRWEPLATTLRSGAVGRLYREAEERRTTVLQSEAGGILPVLGPINYRGERWLGWEARTGENIFPYKKVPLKELVKTAFPLILSYRNYHRTGVTVGCPDWGRIYRDQKGVFMPDPALLSYLPANPLGHLPAGLAACRPPEAFRGESPGRTGDLYYLGLILYILFTGKLPYPLDRGWPHRALLAGQIIPPIIFRPELSPRIAGIITALMAPDKGGRPNADEVVDLWGQVMERGYLAAPEEMTVHLRKERSYSRRERLRSVTRPVKIAAVLLGGVLILKLFISGIYLRPVQSPLQATEEFYRSVTDLGASFTSSYKSIVVADFFAAGVKRRQIAADLLSRPLAEVEKIEMKSVTGKETVMEATLIWWEWAGGLWKKRRAQERIFLKRRGRGWEITRRLPLGE